jgi:hypothetical protein
MSREALANVLGMAFATYANRVQNGAVDPYLGLLKSPSVDVVITVMETGVIIAKPYEPIVQETIAKPETAEAQVETVVEAPVVEPIMEEQPKPKRKRKKKTE